MFHNVLALEYVMKNRNYSNIDYVIRYNQDYKVWKYYTKKNKNLSNHPGIFSELSIFVYQEPKSVEIFKIVPFFTHGHPLL